jgi:glycerophosphoryl diester phosphodiesterase
MRTSRYACLMRALPLVLAVLLFTHCKTAAQTVDVESDSTRGEVVAGEILSGIPDVLADARVSEQGRGETDTRTSTMSVYECLRTVNCGRVMVAAHRGLHITWPENSLAAIRAAAEGGIALAEVDVRHTMDEVLVLMHDHSVDRTTNGTGPVSSLTWSEIEQLELSKGDPNNPESTRVPTFEAALQLAVENGIVLYVDQKTARWDLVQALVQDGNYYAAALIRDGPATIEDMISVDPDLLVMPAMDNILLLQAARVTMPNLQIVELANSIASPDFVAYAHASAIKVQQDVMVCDLLAIGQDYSCWQEFIDSGVDVLQSDFPHVLGPLVETYNETGIFPSQDVP